MRAGFCANRGVTHWGTTRKTVSRHALAEWSPQCAVLTRHVSYPFVSSKLTECLVRDAPSSSGAKVAKVKNYKGNMDSGRSVPRSGTYGFFHAHSAHREITLLRGRVFPFCPKCLDALHFVLLRAVPAESASARFRLLMHGTTSLPQKRDTNRL
jgi:hypothetical protein